MTITKTNTGLTFRFTRDEGSDLSDKLTNIFNDEASEPDDFEFPYIDENGEEKIINLYQS